MHTGILQKLPGIADGLAYDYKFYSGREFEGGK